MRVYYCGVIKPKEIKKEIDDKLRNDANEWLYREGKYENVRMFVSASKNIDQRDDVISLFRAHDVVCLERRIWKN